MSTKISVLYDYGIVPIRHAMDRNFDWIDVSAFSQDIIHAEMKVDRSNIDVPNWTKKNPVTGYANVVVITTVPGMTLEIRTPGTYGTERITIE